MSAKRMRFRRFAALLGGSVGGAGRAGCPVPGKARGGLAGLPGGAAGPPESRASAAAVVTPMQVPSLMIITASRDGEAAAINAATTGSREWRRTDGETSEQFLTRVKAAAPRPAVVVVFPSSKEISP
jgi:hypothetical protein